MSRTLPVLLALTIACVAAAGPKPAKAPAAEPTPTTEPARAPIAEYRHTVMEGVGDHMKAISMVVKGKVDRPIGDVALHAEAMVQVSRTFTELFPAGSGPDAGPTDALPAVWDNPDEFATRNQTWSEAAAKLAEVARTGDLEATKAQFGALGKSCGGCHETFRKKDE
jgi:cytochrome c556